MGRPPNTELRREQIMQGLLSVMAERGYERASIAQIGKAAGLSPGLIHYHFDNKEAILLGLVEVLVTGLRERLDDLTQRAGDDAWERLFAVTDAFLATGRGSDPRATTAWVVIGAEAVRLPEVRKAYAAATAEHEALIRSRLVDVLRAEGRATRKVRKLSAAVLAYVAGAFQLSVAAPDTIPRGFAAPTARDFIRGLVEREARRD